MISPLISFSKTTRACGNCEFWEGARQVQEDGTTLCVENGCGFCLRRDGDLTQFGILDAITESGSNRDCLGWHPVRPVPSYSSGACG